MNIKPFVIAILGAVIAFGVNAQTEPAQGADTPAREDVQSLAGDMYRSYLYGGLPAMLATENACWARVTGEKTIAIAKLCASAAIAGAMVEAAYAQQEGRGPAPSYATNGPAKRIQDKSNLTGEPLGHVLVYAINSQNDVVGGLFLAGMR